jgi:ferredoxin
LTNLSSSTATVALVRVAIDHDRCTGHGRCYALAPELFVDDDAGYGQVIGDGTLADEAATAAAQRVVIACPERAVAILEEERT